MEMDGYQIKTRNIGARSMWGPQTIRLKNTNRRTTFKKRLLFVSNCQLPRRERKAPSHVLVTSLVLFMNQVLEFFSLRY